MFVSEERTTHFPLELHKELLLLLWYKKTSLKKFVPSSPCEVLEKENTCIPARIIKPFFITLVGEEEFTSSWGWDFGWLLNHYLYNSAIPQEIVPHKAFTCNKEFEVWCRLSQQQNPTNNHSPLQILFVVYIPHLRIKFLLP
ncbi:hypothetical protein ACFLZ9_02130 [Patescibacteria group bacterium]